MTINGVHADGVRGREWLRNRVRPRRMAEHHATLNLFTKAALRTISGNEESALEFTEKLIVG